MKTLPLILAAAALATTAPAQTTLIIPSGVDEFTDGGTGVEHPFGWDGYSTVPDSARVMYLYDRSHFVGVHTPITITRLRLRADWGRTFNTGAGGTFGIVEVRAGTSGLQYDNASTQFAQNYPGGVEPAPAYAGPVTVQAWTGNDLYAPGDWVVDITLTTPVTYDPRGGDDFLLDFRIDGTFTGMLNDLPQMDEHFGNGAGSIGAKRLITTANWNDPVGSLGGSAERGLACELTFTPATGRYAAFSADNPTPGPGQTVTFTDLSVSDAPGGVLATSWDFDGDMMFDAIGSTATWTYTTCGPHPVMMEIIDATGFVTYTWADGIVVGAPTADFTAAWSGAGPVSVQFTDTSEGAPTSWAWDFDRDGTVDSTLQNPTWVFPKRDAYEIELVASNACGASAPLEKGIDLREQLCAGFPWEFRLGSINWSHFFDADVKNPAGLTITEIGAHQNQNPGIYTAIAVYTKSGSYVGHDGNQAAWTLRASVNAPSAGKWNDSETVYDVPDFHLPPGNHAFAIVYTVGGPGFPAGQLTEKTVGNNDLELTFGAQRSFQFAGNRFEARGWSGCLYYCVGDGRGTVASLGGGCTNSTGGTATLTGRGGVAPAIGETFVLDLAGAPANRALTSTIISVLALPIPIDLGIIGAPGCVLHPDPLIVVPTPTDGTGKASLNISISANRDTVGFNLFAQTLFVDTGINQLGLGLSHALQGVVGCKL